MCISQLDQSARDRREMPLLFQYSILCILRLKKLLLFVSVYTSTYMIDYCVDMYAVAHVWRISSLLPPFLRSIGYWAFVANAFTYRATLLAQGLLFFLINYIL